MEALPTVPSKIHFKKSTFREVYVTVSYQHTFFYHDNIHSAIDLNVFMRENIEVPL